MTPHFGRAVRGERVHDAIPKNHGSNVTILGALSCQGMEVVMTIDGAADTQARQLSKTLPALRLHSETRRDLFDRAVPFFQLVLYFVHFSAIDDADSRIKNNS